MIPARLLAGKGVLYLAGGLAALLVASNLAWFARAAGLRADLSAARADAQLAETERDAWKAKAADLLRANQAGQAVVDALQIELANAQRQARELDAQGRRALAAARAQAATADQRLREFRARYERQSGTPDCAAALAALPHHCPQFEGY